MALNHFTEAFAGKAEKLVNDLKAAGASATDAVRTLELTCGRENEEFAVDGIPLVERIYDGRYDRSSSSFEPNPPPPAPIAEAPAAPPVDSPPQEA